ncbi:MAG: universal stress protein [Granulicella sp.]
MYKKIMVAYDESPQAKLALASGIELARQLGAELNLIAVSEPLPAYVAYVEAAFQWKELFSKAMKYRLSWITRLPATK